MLRHSPLAAVACLPERVSELLCCWRFRGGQRRMAEHLLALGAELNGTPSWGDSTPLGAADSLGTGRESLLTWLKAQGPKKTAVPVA